MSSHLVMVLPDLHIPDHDPLALECALKIHETLRPARTVILGDWLDAEGFGKFRNVDFASRKAHDFKLEEVDPCNEVLDRLQENTDLLVYIEGNHEFRIELCAANLGKQFEGIYSLISPERLLSEGRNDFLWVPYREKLSHYKIAKDLLALHGWTYGKDAARKHLAYAKRWSLIFGHTHLRLSAMTREPITDQYYKAISPGCLANLQPKYRTHEPTDWVHGVELFYVKDDLTKWQNFPIDIINGEAVLPDGRLIRS
jgi:predicted phosphodiesterase